MSTQYNFRNSREEGVNWDHFFTAILPWEDGPTRYRDGGYPDNLDFLFQKMGFKEIQGYKGSPHNVGYYVFDASDTAITIEKVIAVFQEDLPHSHYDRQRWMQRSIRIAEVYAQEMAKPERQRWLPGPHPLDGREYKCQFRRKVL